MAGDYHLLLVSVLTDCRRLPPMTTHDDQFLRIPTHYCNLTAGRYTFLHITTHFCRPLPIIDYCRRLRSITADYYNVRPIAADYKLLRPITLYSSRLLPITAYHSLSHLISLDFDLLPADCCL